MSENSKEYGHLTAPTIHTLDEEFKFTLCRNGAHAPARANPGDAGIDFFIPNYTWGSGESDACELKPGARVTIASGVKVEVPAGYALVFMNKGGIATKFGLIVGACVTDHGYKGEVFINIINTNNENSVYLMGGDKIVQGLLIPVGLHQLVETELEDMYDANIMLEGDREDGDRGSTGTNINEDAVTGDVGDAIDADWQAETPED